MAWTDRTRERFHRGGVSGAILLAFGVVVVLIAIFLLRNVWPG